MYSQLKNRGWALEIFGQGYSIMFVGLFIQVKIANYWMLWKFIFFNLLFKNFIRDKTYRNKFLKLN